MKTIDDAKKKHKRTPEELHIAAMELDDDGASSLVGAIINSEGSDYIKALKIIYRFEEKLKSKPKILNHNESAAYQIALYNKEVCEEWFNCDYVRNLCSLEGDYLIKRFNEMAMKEIEEEDHKADEEAKKKNKKEKKNEANSVRKTRRYVSNNKMKTSRA